MPPLFFGIRFFASCNSPRPFRKKLSGFNVAPLVALREPVGRSSVLPLQRRAARIRCL